MLLFICRVAEGVVAVDRAAFVFLGWFQVLRRLRLVPWVFSRRPVKPLVLLGGFRVLGRQPLGENLLDVRLFLLSLSKVLLVLLNEIIEIRVVQQGLCGVVLAEKPGVVS